MAKRILLADDSITIQKVVELTFSDGDYEVTAVNNGAKAIQKLSEMRPDIILSDIIMPEKNGYEVCEFVKSHPEFRNIPVILLTGTFEPFDPDRADKAGCDAVVTKPFESQSLIHKVEELVEHAKSQAPTAPGGMPAFSGDSFAPAAPTPQPAAPAPPPPPPAPAPSSQYATGTFEPHGDIFAEQTPPAPEAPAGGETRAFPKLDFSSMAPPPSEPASPWDEPAPAGGETRAIPKMSFDDLQQMAKETPQPAAPPPPPPPPAASSPWDEEQPAPAGETRAFPRMSFDDLEKMAGTPPTAPPSASMPEPPPWDSPPPAGSSSDDTIPPFAPPAFEPPPPIETTSSIWDDAPSAGGETRAMPRMSFEDLEKLASQAPAPAPEPPAAPSWQPSPRMADDEAGGDELPFASPKPAAAPALSMQQPPEGEATTSASAATSGELTDEQVDRIARRVVQLMSEQVVRNIAWEVIPDLAEMVVKERIRQLESE